MKHPLYQCSLLISALAWLPACTFEPELETLLPASAYAGEPYPVRVVNRARFDDRLLPRRVANTTGEPAGTIVVETREKLLYFAETDATAVRYGVAVGGVGRAWSGVATIGRKSEWPAWYPTDEMHAAAPGMPRRIPPGPGNPLGARALYLYADGKDTLYRIHGTSEPWTIGTEVSSGCIRMFNEDIIRLFAKVKIGSRVVVR
jgi:lipoprotein-anchoring transpeptidase ErfK/SrfK